ncbi:MAG TPA: ArsA-related P-loop ATPase [Candidatus Saccharimonadales bacterium]|nr:ArsA-related P-loop ATPase [Candidatus Saccharimonadales bacterium]
MSSPAGMPPRSWSPSIAVRSAIAGERIDLATLLRRRVIFVAGKGGTGRTTITAALALLAAKAGKRVLAIDVDAGGDLAAALGSPPSGFAPRVVQRNLSVLELRTDESFQEYLSIYFKVPRLTRLTPLARVFDFIATGVPGPRDMLVVGKIAYEERRKEDGGTRPVWDLILVDSAPGGQVESHLASARAMLTLVKGGVIRAQVEWIDALIRDPRRTTVVLCALPEEMPVTEAIELHERMRAGSGVAVDACILNRAVTEPVTPAHRRFIAALLDPEYEVAVSTRLGGSPALLEAGLDLEARLYDTSSRYAKLLRSRLPMPVLPVPAIADRPGLTTTRAVADALGTVLS